MTFPRSIIAVACVALVGAAPLQAAPPPWYADIVQTMRARKALHDDPSLAPYNIGVCVHNRVATLFGPAPTLDLALRAEARLRALFELVEIRNELIVPLDELVPQPAAPPLFMPERSPPAVPQPRPFLRRDGDGSANLARVGMRP
jgi:hypothetical protein